MIAETSQQAYDQIKGKLGDRQKQVYDALGDIGVATNEQLAEHLGWPINRVTGRVTELHKYGLVGIEGLGQNKTGFTAKLWGVRDPNDSELLKLAQWEADCGE